VAVDDIRIVVGAVEEATDYIFASPVVNPKKTDQIH
jgi:hypothetical protein